MTDLERLSRPHDPAFRCSPWTRAQGVDPIGSATAFDALVLVECPLPWPEDVSDIPVLAAASAIPGVRVMAVVPRPDAAADGLVHVVHRRRTATNHLAGVDHRVPPGEVADLLAVLAADPLGDHLDLPSAVGESPPEVLVCGHGRRDACCGQWGTRLHADVVDRWAGVRVWRCSHTGGHRFAPTAITLPDGRAWAYIDAGLLDHVVHRRGDVAALARHDRGTSGLDPWAQVVERALFEARGWGWLDQDLRHTATEVTADGQGATVTLEWEGGSATGVVEVARTVPVLVCGAPPEQATKTSVELALHSLRVS